MLPEKHGFVGHRGGVPVPIDSTIADGAAGGGLRAANMCVGGCVVAGARGNDPGSRNEGGRGPEVVNQALGLRAVDEFLTFEYTTQSRPIMTSTTAISTRVKPDCCLPIVFSAFCRQLCRYWVGAPDRREWSAGFECSWFSVYKATFVPKIAPIFRGRAQELSIVSNIQQFLVRILTLRQHDDMRFQRRGEA